MLTSLRELPLFSSRRSDASPAMMLRSPMVLIALAATGCGGVNTFVPPPMNENATAIERKLQVILDKAVGDYGLPGAQAGVRLPDGTVAVVTSGTRDLGRRDVPIGRSDLFRIGSTTKMFVAALIGRLAEKDLLSFDDVLGKWVPDLPDAGEITIRQLLSHRSGIPERLFTKPTILVKSAFLDHVRWDALEVIQKTTTDIDAGARHGARFQYSNNNYLILGIVAQRAAGKAVSALLHEEFFGPLGMRNTFLLPYYEAVPPGLAQGYDEFIPLGPHTIWPDNTSWDSLTFTAGAMASTADDLLTWLDALFHGRVLSAATLSEMEQFGDSRANGRDDGMVGYGLGIARYDLEGRELLGHPGGGFGGECFPFHDPRSDVSVVVVYNLSRKDNPAGKQVLRRIIDEVIDAGAAPSLAGDSSPPRGAHGH